MPQAPRPPRILAATGDGAVLYDPVAGVTSGHDRTAGEVWRFYDGEVAVNVVCLARCPDTVVSEVPSGLGKSAAPFLPGGGARTPFPISGAARAHVLAARSLTDAVVEEGDSTGRSWIRVVRPGGNEWIEVAHHAYEWIQSADGVAAFAFPRSATAPERHLLRFARTADGWRYEGDGPGTSSLGARVRACVAAAGECEAGAGAAALVTRSIEGRGRYRTLVRGLDDRGATTWSHDFEGEVGVTAHPAAPYIGVSAGGVFRLIDRAGGSLRHRDGVVAARFTAEGDLVVVSPDGLPGWLGFTPELTTEKPYSAPTTIRE